MGLSTLFPESYSPWLAKRLKGQILESMATCESCAMVKPDGLTRDPGPFQAHLKCCTYFPYIPNFSLGKMLSENSAIIKLRIKTAEAQGLLLPVGLHITPERQNLIDELGESGFGNSPELLCPFYDTQNLGCTVWQHRPAVCTTYFCKSNREESGLEFWSDVETYLNHFEWTLAREVFYRMGLTQDEMSYCKEVIKIEKSDEDHPAFMAAAWGTWFHKKDEFYQKAYDCALKITPQELDALLGEDYLSLEESLRSRV